MDAAEVLRLGADAAARCGVVLSACDVDGGAELSVHGRQAHASTPWEGANGITALLAVLSSLPLADCESTRTIRTLAELLPARRLARRDSAASRRRTTSPVSSPSPSTC